MLLRITLLLLTCWSLQLLAAKKTFIYCSEGSPSTFNPQLASDGTSFNASSRTVYNRLVEFERGKTRIVPGLAQSWSYDPAKMTWTFNLRQGVQWHSNTFYKPTRTFNADDVLFSFNRQRIKDHPWHKVSGGRYIYFEAMKMSEIISDIIKVNDHQVKFVLTRNYTPFLPDMAMDFASILSKEYADRMLAAKTPEKLDRHPIGTGPFVFGKYIKDSQVRFTAHRDHFGGKSPLDQLIFSITVDNNVRFQKLKTRECHLIAYPAVQDLPAIRKNGKLRLMEKEGMNVAYLAFNVEKKPFDNVLVRKAVHHALNRAHYIKTVYKGTAVVAKNPMPPSVLGYNEQIKDYPYDPKLARKLLKQAGYAKGFNAELWTLPVQRPYIPDGKKLGVLMQADLAAVGIKVKLVTYDWPTYLSKADNGEHQLLQLGWSGDNGDPDNFLRVLLSCGAVASGANTARWCNKKFSALVKKAAETTDSAKRVEYYRAAQQVFKDEVPWVTLAHAKVFRGMSQQVKNYRIDPLGSDRFDGVDLQ